MGDCGVHYRIEVLEQFKGKLPTTAWFVTHKLLYPEMPLSVGEEIVILARDLTRLRADDPFRDDLESIRSTLQECRANVPSLYVAYFEDNVFPLLRKVGTDGPSLWLEHSGQTKPAAGLEARGTGRCRPQSDGSCRHNPAVAWPEVQRAFKEWARK